MFITWCLLIGGLLMLIGLSDTLRQRLPFSSSAIYLVVGYLLGPQVLGYMDLRLPDQAGIFERLAEAAVLVSLFAVGLRLRVRLSDRLWLAPLMLATAAMVVTIGLMVLAGLGLGHSLAVSLLIASILAPTDPVLASDVQVRDIADRDSLRFSLTGEGGLNDGIAFPFVMLALGLMGLHDLGDHGGRWWGIDLAWSTLAGLALGALFGLAFSKAVVWLRREKETAFGMESFLTLGLIAVTYGSALLIHAAGFLAVFAAGLAVRQFEHQENIEKRGLEAAEGEEVDKIANAVEGDPEQASAYIAKAVLEFSLDLEKLAELTVMLAIGSLLSASAFTRESLAVAFLLIFVARPVAVYATTWTMRLTSAQRRLLAWFGTRGIGSMYYLAYAVAHGMRGEALQPVVDAVLVTIALSVLLHGSSATPVMDLYRRKRGDEAA